MLSKRLLLLSFILALASTTCVRAAYAGNVAPTIAGSPRPAVPADRYYSFQPTASDADGDKLTFGVAGLPRWAAFDRRTGRLYGRPRAADVGKSRPITIAVSDGRKARTLATFTINVRAATSIDKAPTIAGSPHRSQFPVGRGRRPYQPLFALGAKKL